MLSASASLRLEHRIAFALELPLTYLERVIRKPSIDRLMTGESVWRLYWVVNVPTTDLRLRAAE